MCVLCSIVVCPITCMPFVLHYPRCARAFVLYVLHTFYVVEYGGGVCLVRYMYS